jgi:site-specific DNA recombinase
MVEGRHWGFSLDIGQIESELDVVLIVKGWQGSDERAKIRERSMRGKRAKAQAGKVVGVRAPYGYQHVRDSHGKVETLEPVDETAQIVKLIYQWYVYGDEKGIPLSTGTITRRLSEMGIPTPGELKEYKNRRRENCFWTRDTIVSILGREMYAGTWYFGVSHSRDEWIPVDVPAIIDRETWQRAQQKKSQDFELAKSYVKQDYLLSGYIRCFCGFSMVGKIYHSSPRYLYYCCNRRYNRFKGENDICKARSVRAAAIEPAVWESIVELFADNGRIK